MNDDLSLDGRLARVRERIVRACGKAGRDPAGVTLVAVSKFHPAEAVAALRACGQRIFGESYVQEALPKMEALADAGIQWHFIGRLQKNKAKFAVGRFALIHTVDSVELARTLQNKALAASVVQPVLIQVNVDDEPQKAGVAASLAPELAEAVVGMANLDLQGLMVLPRALDDPQAARPAFAALRVLRDALATRLGRALPVLSMGMSGDLEPAVEEGATHVRIGTDIFGPRHA
ncbi:YggS family pyridoxal phosphate-dependent enzyme [Desulfolutivibrio sulfodismutans]|uniref:YggS family pyridoxal phosphate-dependent enzyme n=1 Tax=Desulfolutivibrio sulfodismutans TaxID=63561 RepID=UPI00159D324A|nr:YggS family pyridoxal phosphate-dependent enzyme [Desulfolutivibrio sulfodismutans]QLA13134.1 YggS family pyridoxal phosphate-dependent enzyme [Desulfolutivibrio sulfodismutans DSM 3696]